MSFLTLDLNLLRVFDAVMTEQNLTRAAGHLAMTQPAVSNAIKRLRESLGDELLIQVSRRLSAHCGSDGFAARLGGDEFAIILPDIPKMSPPAQECPGMSG